MQGGTTVTGTVSIGTTVLERFSTATAIGKASATVSPSSPWAAAVATFKAQTSTCGAGGTCLPQTCLADTCYQENCFEAEGRWCQSDATRACSSASDCANWTSAAVCRGTTTNCNPANITSCMNGETCTAGDTCNSVTNVATATPGAQTIQPPPAAAVRQYLWTVNDSVDARRGRDGIKIAWTASGGLTSNRNRVYRSASAAGPFCALVGDGAQNPALPLPPGVTQCQSDVPGRTVSQDVAGNDPNYSTASGVRVYWDRTAATGRMYYYRVSELTSSAETPLSATNMTTAKGLPYDPNMPIPPQGFRAWTSQTGNIWDKASVSLRWCPAPTASGVPSVTEYRVYRNRLDQTNEEYRLLARLSSSCIGSATSPPTMRCEITTTNSCVTDESTWQQRACAAPENVITPIACNDITGPRCGVVDKTYTCWPRPDWPNTFQFLRNRTYFATAVSSTGMESPPSMLNQAWLNYCGIAGGSDCPATPSGCAQRRDPDGDGDYLVCGDESAMLMSPGAPGPLAPDSANPADTAVCETLDGVDPDDLYAGIMAPQRIIGQVDPNPPSRYIYYHLDHLGSPRLETDAAGAKIAEHHYLPFGDERPSQADPTKNTRAFTGHERDDETGLDYMLARYYSSSLGRFMAVDPSRHGVQIGFPQSWNRYSYAYNNPLRYTDPTGMWPEPFWFPGERWLEESVWGQRILGAVYSHYAKKFSVPMAYLFAAQFINSPVGADDQYYYSNGETEARVTDSGYVINQTTGLLFDPTGYENLPFDATKNGFDDPRNAYAYQDQDHDGIPNKDDPDIDGDGTPNERDPDPTDPHFGGTQGDEPKPPNPPKEPGDGGDGDGGEKGKGHIQGDSFERNTWGR